jgi:hypothetical protein
VTPQVRVVRGNPDDVEVAALVAGLAANASVLSALADLDEQGSAARRRWREAAGRLAHPLTSRNPDAWRWSLR